MSPIGDPHIGHAYEAITADVLSRYQRMAGKKVFFQTGSDEHGQKIANTAAALGVQPIDICDKYAGESLCNMLGCDLCLSFFFAVIIRSIMIMCRVACLCPCVLPCLLAVSSAARSKIHQHSSVAVISVGRCMVCFKLLQSCARYMFIVCGGTCLFRG